MSNSEDSIIQSHPRRRIRVTLPDDKVLEGPCGATMGDFLTSPILEHEAPLMAGICNGQLRELTYTLEHDSQIAPVLLSNSDGGRIYRRSLILLLTTAAAELWPGSKISVRYAVPDGGFYCTRLDAQPFTATELETLSAHMRSIVNQGEPITKRNIPTLQAIQIFASRGDDDKVRLLEQRSRTDLTLYELRGREDYYYGYMVPDTGYLQYFKLVPMNSGFIVQYPRKEHPTKIQPIRAYEKLRTVFQQTDEWLRRMDVEDVGRLNSIVREKRRLFELILVAEALHERYIAHIAGMIREANQLKGTRVVLIAGPSSSGKTTFAKRLSIQLLAHGMRPFVLELDNYFVDRDLTPRDEKGDYDVESLNAVNLDLFNNQLLQLTAGKTVTLPKFDFLTGKSIAGREAKLQEKQIIIIEGIHGLNPALVPVIPPELVFRVYVSALTQLNIDSHNRVPTTDVRLIRRLVRDARHRGYSATQTIKRWPSVRRGEKDNIFPYQENADIMFNSALVYELAAMRPIVEPLLLQVEPNTPPHIEAKRLLSFLNWVHPLDREYLAHIPDTSLLREFLGGLSLANYVPLSLDDDTN
jgi:uridine kinase